MKTVENTQEVWVPIKGFEGYYEVSNHGRYRSLDRVINGVFYKGCDRNLDTAKRGYRVATLCKNSKKQRFLIARLVGFAFPEICGEYFEGAEINHLDENKANNFASNLRWSTSTENLLYGTRIKRIAETRQNTVLQYDLKGNFIKEWVSAKKAAETLGYQACYIRAGCRGTRKNPYGFIWKYKKGSGSVLGG